MACGMLASAAAWTMISVAGIHDERRSYKLLIPTWITTICIEQRPPPSATIQCFHCHADCPSGKRRRDPYGTSLHPAPSHRLLHSVQPLRPGLVTVPRGAPHGRYGRTSSCGLRASWWGSRMRTIISHRTCHARVLRRWSSRRRPRRRQRKIHRWRGRSATEDTWAEKM